MPNTPPSRLRVTAGGFLVGAMLTTSSAFLVRNGARWRRQTEERLSSESRVVTTAAGPIEFGELGEGSPVLVLHGTPGGYDQGLAAAKLMLGDCFRLIAPSRPGYLRTPLSTGRSPAEQADAVAALLDELDLDRVAIIGISGGGPSAVQLAVRHPERVSRLALLEAVTASTKLAADNLVRGPLTWDAVAWLIVSAANTFGGWIVPGDARTAETVAAFKHLAATNFPLDVRRTGTLNDAEFVESLDEQPLSRIKVPTLVIHGTHDRSVPVEQSEDAARQIRGARLFLVEGRDHTTTLVTPSACEELKRFLRE